MGGGGGSGGGGGVGSGGGGGGGSGWGVRLGQGRCEQRFEVFGKIQKKKIGGGGGGGGGQVGGGGGGGGVGLVGRVRVEVNAMLGVGGDVGYVKQE